MYQAYASVANTSLGSIKRVCRTKLYTMFIIVLNKKLNEPAYEELSRSTKDCGEETSGQKTSEHRARKYEVDFILHLLLSHNGLTPPGAGAHSASACGGGDATLNMYYSIINPIIKHHLGQRSG